MCKQCNNTGWELVNFNGEAEWDLCRCGKEPKMPEYIPTISLENSLSKLDGMIRELQS